VNVKPNERGQDMLNKITFDTEMKPIQVCGGRKIADRKAVVRTDTGAVLGIVGNNYKPIPHLNVVEQFNKMDMLELTQVDSCREGAIMFAHYNIKQNGIVKKEDVQVGDAITFGLRAFNSFNSVFGIGFEIVANRLVCKNGLVVPKAMARLSLKHFQTTDIKQFREIIVEKSMSMEQALKIWREWIKIIPTEQTIQNFFEYAEIGKRLTKQLYDDCVNESKKMGVWGAYNRLTRYTTHELRVRNEDNRTLSQRSKEQTLLQKFYDFGDNWRR